VTDIGADREEAKKEDTFDYSAEFEEEEDEEWEQEADWNNEADETEDVKDESAAYLDFLNEEVNLLRLVTKTQTDHKQAQKFSALDDDDDDELEEESLLETPLDKVEPYGMFKHALLRKYRSSSHARADTNRVQVFNKSSLRFTRTLPRTLAQRSSKWSRAPFTRPTSLHKFKPKPKLLPPMGSHYHSSRVALSTA
jgi:hypothetical protein